MVEGEGSGPMIWKLINSLNEYVRKSSEKRMVGERNNAHKVSPTSIPRN